MVAYGRWSLTRSGRYERVDCIPLKAFTQASRSFTGETALVSFCQDKFKQHLYYLSLPEFPLPYPLSLDGSTEKMVMLYTNFLTLLSSIKFPISIAIGGSAKNSQIHHQKPLIKLFFS